MPDLTCAELARRYGVARSTVIRALRHAGELHTANSAYPAPPAPVNPGEPQLRYPSEAADEWWRKRSRWAHRRVAERENTN